MRRIISNAIGKNIGWSQCFRGWFTAIFGIAVAFVAAPFSAMAQPYVITSPLAGLYSVSGPMSFSGSLDAVIKDIRDHAGGANVAIQFGNGDVLDIGLESVRFENQDSIPNSYWRTITFTGSITSANKHSTIYIGYNISANVEGNIENTVADDYSTAISFEGSELNINDGGVVSILGGLRSGAISNNGWGKVNVNNGGKVKAKGKYSYAIRNFRGDINVSGGLVTMSDQGTATIHNNAGTVAVSSGGRVIAMDGTAIINDGGGKITVDNGAEIRAEGYRSDAIFNYTGPIIISGGKVISTGEDGNAIRMLVSVPYYDKIDISDGEVIATGEGGRAISIWGGTVNLSGNGLVTSDNESENSGTIHLFIGAKLNITGGTVINTSRAKFGNPVYPAANYGEHGAVFVKEPIVLSAASDGKVEGNGGKLIYRGYYCDPDYEMAKAAANTGYEFVNWAEGENEFSKNAILTKNQFTNPVNIAELTANYDVAAVSLNCAEDLVVMRWGTTLTVVNNPNENDGYVFDSFAWHHKGTEVSNGQSWFFGGGESLQAGDIIRLELEGTDKNGGSVQFDCEYEFKPQLAKFSVGTAKAAFGNVCPSCDAYDASGRRIEGKGNRIFIFKGGK